MRIAEWGMGNEPAELLFRIPHSALRIRQKMLFFVKRILHSTVNASESARIE